MSESSADMLACEVRRRVTMLVVAWGGTACSLLRTWAGVVVCYSKLRGMGALWSIRQLRTAGQEAYPLVWTSSWSEHAGSS